MTPAVLDTRETPRRRQSNGSPSTFQRDFSSDVCKHCEHAGCLEMPFGDRRPGVAFDGYDAAAAMKDQLAGSAE